MYISIIDVTILHALFIPVVCRPVVNFQVQNKIKQLYEVLDL